MRRKSLELERMRNSEALKYQIDNEHCKQGLLSLHEIKDQLSHLNLELHEQCKSLKASLEAAEDGKFLE